MPISKLDRRGEDLREACHSGDADKVHALISQGVDVNDANKVSSPSVHHALFGGLFVNSSRVSPRAGTPPNTQNANAREHERHGPPPLHLSHIPALHSLNEPHPSHHSRTMANLQSDEQLDPIALGCEYETNRISGKEGGRRSKKRAYSGLTHSTGGVCGKEPKNLTDTAIVASRCSTA